MTKRSTFFLLSLLLAANCALRAVEPPLVTVVPVEATDAVLQNPDMGWVLYENYPVDQHAKGSSTLLTWPNESFAEVNAVALMFSWQDIEKREGEYDFSKADFAYDYWAQRGKEIHLRVSTTTLMWWSDRNPPGGKGAPDYVLARMSPAEKQTRTLEGREYVVEDARSNWYRKRLTRFLDAVATHFTGKRKVTLIDLRGFGVWGEWHSGFQYPTLKARRDALIGIIDTWSDAFPDHRLALSYSYDSDGPRELYAGTTSKFDVLCTTNYVEFLAYSAFDHALKKPDITFRRDGCGGAVHSNERKLNEEAFRLGRTPMMSEFVDGYAQSAKGGTNWVNWKIADALSLHPNYINLLGWCCGDALSFARERPDLIAHGLRRMGYRFVPTRVQYPAAIKSDQRFTVNTEWVNRGVGRALRDYELQLRLINPEGVSFVTAEVQRLRTSEWIEGQTYSIQPRFKFKKVPPDDYQLALQLRDPQTTRIISLPLVDVNPDGSYPIGRVQITSP